MGKLNLVSDEASLLKAYGLPSLSPKKWEEIDHDKVDSVAGALAGAQGDVEVDPLGVRRSIPDLDQLDMEAKAAILISSKSFDPKAFLSHSHPNATYQDLTAGISHLKSAIDARAEAIRILVEDNIDRFVAVKASSDAVYAEMTEGLLAEDTEFASKTVTGHLKAATVKANQVFLPVLENASKANKVRSTLGVFERSKFFFNLPGSLREAIEDGKYDAALRDYKKGKFLLDSRPNQLFPNPSPATSNEDRAVQKDLEAQQNRIFDKLWSTVERVMGGMRGDLLAKLKEVGRPIEEQEKIIEILLEIGTPTGEDPTWAFFDSQHAHVTSAMKSMREAHVALIEDTKRMLPSDAGSSNLQTQNSYIASHLRTCIAALGTPQSEAIISKSSGWETWQAITEFVKSVSDVMLANLPNFWKIGKAYLDGKYKKANDSSTSRRSPTQVRTMATDIVKTYISVLSEFFGLSDMAVAKKEASEPKFLPLGASSLITSHYLLKILQEINECINDLGATEISSEASAGLKELMDSVRWKFEDALAFTWVQDARIFHYLENWEADIQNPEVTLYLTKMQTFQKQNVSSAYKIAGINEILSPASSKTQANKTIRPEFGAKISKAFLDALYAFLDGLVHLASDDWQDMSVSSSHEVVGNSRDLTRRGLDLSSTHTRLLLVLSNLSYLSQAVIPSMFMQMDSVFVSSVEEERQTMISVLTEVDRTLFEDYMKQTATRLTRLIREGIMDTHMDWLDTPRPNEVRPYIFETLMYLVGVHAHVSTVAKRLLERTLNSLIEDLVEEALACFRQVKRFGMGGMLRATLEIEFMHHVLKQYVTPKAESQLTEIYNKISEAYVRRPGDENLQQELEGVKKTLSDTRKATGIDFLCFRGPTRKNEGSSSKSDRTRERRERSGRERQNRV